MSKKGIDKYIRAEHINNMYKEMVSCTFFFGGVWMTNGQVYDEAKRLSTSSAWDASSLIKKGFSLCPFTLNSVLFLGSTIITTPCGKTVRTMNGPDQRVFSFPAKI